MAINELILWLEKTQEKTDISAILLSKNDLKEEEYKELAKAFLPKCQKFQTALLLDNEPQLAKEIGADGVHISGDIGMLKDGIKLLKPDMIVGAGNIFSKDDAMIKGESGVDYVFFGEIGKVSSEQTHELASWWAKTFEVPAVYCDANNKVQNFDNANCEFVALSDDKF